tara:strand:+ start:699 stop:965 length:267 start_codon:yes stop_codon:yes gene_type:complete
MVLDLCFFKLTVFFEHATPFFVCEKMLNLEDVLSDIARLGKEHDAALEQHDDCMEAIDAKVGHAKYDAILDEVHTDELTCEELRYAVR